MKLSKPKRGVYFLALILAVLVLVAKFVPAVRDLIPPAVLKYDFWLMTAAYGLLFLGTTFKGF